MVCTLTLLSNASISLGHHKVLASWFLWSASGHVTFKKETLRTLSQQHRGDHVPDRLVQERMFVHKRERWDQAGSCRAIYIRPGKQADVHLEQPLLNSLLVTLYKSYAFQPFPANRCHLPTKATIPSPSSIRHNSENVFVYSKLNQFFFFLLKATCNS